MPTPQQRIRLLLRPAMLTGATWALDGLGRAYNTPTLGSELLTDGGLENWTTATNLTSWTESIAGTSTINQETSDVQVGSSALRMVIDSSNSAAYIEQAALTANRWYQASLRAKSTVAGRTIGITTSGGASATQTTITLATSWAQYTITRLNSDTAFNVKRVTGTSSTIYIDDVSCKTITFPTTVCPVAGTTPTQTAACKIHTLTTGTQAGVVSLLDSTSSPANFLIGYHDGTNVKLDKCVGGTYTNLISTAVAFSSLAQIEIRRPSGNTFQLWYNGSQRGTDQTVSDAGIISNTRYGLFSTHSGNLFTEFSLDGVVIPFTLPGA